MWLILVCGWSVEYGNDVVDVQHAKQISWEEERDENRMEYMTQENGRRQKGMTRIYESLLLSAC
jgi:hypothetical protein